MCVTLHFSTLLSVYLLVCLFAHPNKPISQDLGVKEQIHSSVVTVLRDLPDRLLEGFSG